jgi:hypothetical protein
MGIIGRRLVSDFSFEVSMVEVGGLNQRSTTRPTHGSKLYY